jgi:hypothetical protein
MNESLLRDVTYTVLNASGVVLGSCFRAPVLDSHQPGSYLLSAAHPVRLESYKHQGVSIVGMSKEVHSARIVVCGDGDDPDVSLLYSHELRGAPITCSIGHIVGPVSLRGAPSGLSTKQATLRGRASGVEELGVHQLFEIVLEDVSLLERSVEQSQGDPQSMAYAALRGLSGAPVCATYENDMLAYALVVRRNVSGIANRVYAVPMSTIKNFLGSKGHVLQTTRRARLSDSTLALLVGRLIRRIAEAPGGLHRLWEDMSELFYAGIPIDTALRDAVAQPSKFGFRAPAQIAGLEFLLARLLLKRGETAPAISILRQARIQAAQSSTDEHRQLVAQIDLRMLMQLTGALSPYQRRSQFESGVGRYEEVPGIPDDERAYEVASAIGSEATDLATVADFSSHLPVLGRHFSNLLHKHSLLLRTYPYTLRDKQEIVNIGLSILEVLWDIDRPRDTVEKADLLRALAVRGRLAASQRSNAIFYAQMLVIEAIAARMTGDSPRAFTLLGAVGAALADSDLQLSHEGIKSYVSYLDRNDLVASRVLRASYEVDLSHVTDVLLVHNVITSLSERAALERGLGRYSAIAAGGGVGIAQLFSVGTDLSTA